MSSWMSFFASLATLLAAVAPLWLCAALAWRRFWRHGRTGEVLLAASLTVPAVLMLEVFALGRLPLARPLDALPWVHAGVLAACIAGVWRWRRGVRPLARGLRRAWADAAAGPLGATRWVLAFGLLAQLAATVLACWEAGWWPDGVDYHLPAALQPFWDGHLGAVRTPLVWGDTFVRGGALLKFWGWSISGTDAAFNAPSAAFGWVFMLAVYVAARRLALGRAWAAVAAGLTPLAPIYPFVQSIGHVDMDAAACAVAGAALAIDRPGSASRAWSWPACVACLLGLVLAVSIKFVTIGVIAAVGLYRLGLGVALCVRRDAPRPRGPRHPWAFAGAALVAAVVACPPYVDTWLRYGTPVYPVRLAAGPLVIFDGPQTTASLIPAPPDPLTRFGLVWTSWLTPVSTEGSGGLGPLFALLLAAPMLAMVVSQGVRPRAGWVLAAAVALAALLLPQQHHPRFGFYVLLPAALSMVWLLRSLRDRSLAGGFTLMLLAFMVLSAWFFWRTTVARVLERTGGDLALVATPLRTRELALPPALDDPRYPPRNVRDQVRAFMTAAARSRRDAGQADAGPPILATAVHSSPVHLADARFTYAVEHRPAAPWPVYFQKLDAPAHGADQADAWLDALAAHPRIAGVLVYAGSAEHQALRRAQDNAPAARPAAFVERPLDRPQRGQMRPVFYLREPAR